MKTHRVFIGIMVGVILVQTAFMANYKLRLTRCEAMGDVQVIQQRPHVYIMKLTEAIERLGRGADTVVYQNVWVSRHLEKCLDELEKQRGLEPIALSGFDSPRWYSEGGTRLPSTPVPAEGPFLKPYVEPNFPTWCEQTEEPVHSLLATLNGQALNISIQCGRFQSWITNFEKRLERVQPQQE